jgi:hypothetical protein
MAGAVKLRDQNHQIKPLQVETTKVTSSQKLRESPNDYDEPGCIFDISVDDSMNCRGGFRNRNTRIYSPAAVVPASPSGKILRGEYIPLNDPWRNGKARSGSFWSPR